MNEAAFANAFHYQTHPTQQQSLNYGEGPVLLAGAAPTSAAFSGVLPPPMSHHPLPFRPSAPPADLPAIYNRQQHQHPPHLTTNSFVRPPPLRMAAFSQDDDELARLQELSNKWESDATVSRSSKYTLLGLELTKPTGTAGQRTTLQQRHHHRICQCRSSLPSKDCCT
jgi:hypothetical protein